LPGGKYPWSFTRREESYSSAAQEFEPNETLHDGGLLTVINRTLEPGTPVEMCVSYDANLTRCEYTAVADKGFYSDLILQVDVDAEKQQSRFRGAK
jgi:hypothetical protein